MTSIEHAMTERPRFDYIKATVTIPYDLAAGLADIWYDTFDPERGINRATRHANVSSVRKNRDGTFLYSFEAWGETCSNVVKLDWDQWAPQLQRVDVRGNTEITPGGVDRLYSYLTKHKAGSKNVALFSSRKRSKRQGRDTGGYGIAIGSHKSNLRTTFYVRGSEPGAFEFQCMGTLVENAVAGISTVAQVRPDYANPRRWDTLLMHLYIKGSSDFESVSGLSEAEQHTILLGGPNQVQEREAALDTVHMMLDTLDKSELMQVHEYIQGRLF